MEAQQPNEQEKLLQENEWLKARVKALEKQREHREKAQKKVSKAVAGVVAGKNLRDSVSRLVDEAFDLKLEKETVKDVAYATIRRLTRVGAVTLLLALSPLILATLQTYYLKKQNEKLDFQNRRIEQQTFLQEAERRSSLVFLFDNVLDKLDEELDAQPGARNLSPQLIGRIVALSKALQPYRFLDGDSITATPTSPERGQLLLSLLTSNLSRAAYDQIFLKSDFSYANLQKVNLDGAYLRNINLSFSKLDQVSLVGADLSYARLEGAQMDNVMAFSVDKQRKPTRFDFVNLHEARLTACDLSGSVLEYANFTNATMNGVFFEQSVIKTANFGNLKVDTVHFRKAVLVDCEFTIRKGCFPVFEWDDTALDTATYHRIVRLPGQQNRQLDLDKPRHLINHDTFYIAGQSQPIFVTDTGFVYPLK